MRNQSGFIQVLAIVIVCFLILAGVFYVFYTHKNQEVFSNAHNIVTSHISPSATPTPANVTPVPQVNSVTELQSVSDQLNNTSFTNITSGLSQNDQDASGF